MSLLETSMLSRGWGASVCASSASPTSGTPLTPTHWNHPLMKMETPLCRLLVWCENDAAKREGELDI
ncbi:unnamed protein product [Linum trigynum]|uniref:Uncharacterized protein n=1 Tax=Linum trigynum TaxID=586398 RepID=A0AAV2F717_9ROSI